MKDYGRQNSEHISIGNWILTFILLAIPGINLIAGLCYLLGKKRSKRNYVLACIILWLILAVLTVGAYLLLRFVPSLNNTYESVLNTLRTVWEAVAGTAAPF